MYSLRYRYRIDVFRLEPTKNKLSTNFMYSILTSLISNSSFPFFHNGRLDPWYLFVVQSLLDIHRRKTLKGNNKNSIMHPHFRLISVYSFTMHTPSYHCGFKTGRRRFFCLHKDKFESIQPIKLPYQSPVE